jgi:chromate transporter
MSLLPPHLPQSQRSDFESRGESRSRLAELARLFLKLGVIGFGGPPAHVAMMEEAAVSRSGWLSAEEFAAGVALCELLPGPASTQMGIYIGYVRSGWLGATVAGVCFIAPAFGIVVALSWAYFRFQGLPQIQSVLLGVSPIVLAILLNFLVNFGRKTLKDIWRWGIGLAVLGLQIVGLPLVPLFAMAGAIGAWRYGPKIGIPNAVFLGPITVAVPVVQSVQSVKPIGMPSFWGMEAIGAFAWPLFGFFVKVGTMIFGGGLVIIPLLERAVVDQGWLSRSEFIHGVAIGQLSPGPVVLTAAFVGYRVAGVLGALAATVGVFLPSFLFVLAAAPLLSRLRQNAWISAALKGIGAAVWGAIGAAAWSIGWGTIAQDRLVDCGFVGVVTGLAWLALWRKWPTWLVVPIGGVLGWGWGWLMPIG